MQGGVATFVTSTLPVGSDVVTAAYSGDKDFLGGPSNAVTETIGRAPVSLLVTPSSNPAAFGQPLTLVIDVTPTPAVSAPAPGGSVTVRDGTTVLGTAPVSGGVATFTTSGLSAGGHALSVSYAGDTNFRLFSQPSG